MRQLNKNKQKLYYSQPNNSETIYETDDQGNVIYTDIDGVSVAVISEVKSYYDTPAEFHANISFDGGETKPAEYGLDTSGYNAVISANKGEFPFTEQTLIWHKSEPETDEYKHALPETADYRVAAIKTSLNEERFFLKKRVDDE